MRRLVHLSDLHFGRLEPATLEPLRRAVQDLRPHLVVVSGDLTQRATAAQFRAARGYLEGLGFPFVATPGNHDVPLFDGAARLLRPLQRYRCHFHPDPEPIFVDEELGVATVSTARRLVVRGGRINAEQLERLSRQLTCLPDVLIRVVVTHHPIALMPGARGQRVGRARAALEVLRMLGADLLLAGHLHRAGAGPIALATGRSAIGVQAGTATSSRRRAEANGFNLIELAKNRACIERWVFDGGSFAPGSIAQAFERHERGWRTVG